MRLCGLAFYNKFQRLTKAKESTVATFNGQQKLFLLVNKWCSLRYVLLNLANHFERSKRIRLSLAELPPNMAHTVKFLCQRTAKCFQQQMLHNINLGIIKYVGYMTQKNC